ncbi:CRISPR-associated protein Cas5 [Peptococcaceae bacterium]|nr:CRISPR-associated protein Cas5 [Peptococcaceae bacterium]
MKKLITFRISGRFAHFLKAEAGVSALSYPVPTRTAIIGMIGAIMGFAKDSAQTLLAPLDIALAGQLPVTHWHKAKLRKDPPAILAHQVKSIQKADKQPAPEKATLIRQEWLFNPEYTAWVNLPSQYQQVFETRLRERQWHFQPCLGLSEMSAEIEYLETIVAEKLSPGAYPVQTIFRQSEAQVDTASVYDAGIALHLLRMPRTVTASRVFSHENYVIERNNLPVNLETAAAYSVNGKVVMFL